MPKSFLTIEAFMERHPAVGAFFIAFILGFVFAFVCPS
jgi:hypothetical protein